MLISASLKPLFFSRDFIQEVFSGVKDELLIMYFLDIETESIFSFIA